MTNINEIQQGDVFSEMSHYVYQGKSDAGHVLTHLESKENVVLTTKYVTNLLKNADTFETIVTVGKEDKLWTGKQIADSIKLDAFTAENAPRVGDVRLKGIRTIWEEIHSSQVFTVCFQKADKVKTQKAFKAEKEARIQSYIDQIERVKSQKKGVAMAASAIVEDSITNPILANEIGELRLLRGYKVQFTSRDGKYDCIDMDIEMTGLESGLRPVNINTLQFLVFDGIKYIVE